MMTMQKEFDCVQMKNEIQDKLCHQRVGMTEEQIMAQVEQELESSQTPIAQLWRRIRGKASVLSDGVVSVDR